MTRLSNARVRAMAASGCDRAVLAVGPQRLLLAILLSGGVGCVEAKVLWDAVAPVSLQGSSEFDITVVRCFGSGLIDLDADSRLVITPAGQVAMGSG